MRRIKAGARIWDCDGTADDVQFNAAIASLAGVGGTIQVSAGTFATANDIIIPSGTNGNGIHIIGAGFKNTHIDFTGESLVLGDGTNNSLYDIEIGGITFDGGGGGSDNAIKANIADSISYRLSNVYIHDCEFTAFTGGGNFAAGSSILKLNNIETSMIERCFLHGTYRACIDLPLQHYFCGNLRVRDCYFNPEVTTGCGFYLDASNAHSSSLEWHNLAIETCHDHSEDNHYFIIYNGDVGLFKAVRIIHLRLEDTHSRLFDIVNHDQDLKMFSIIGSQYDLTICNATSGIGTTTGISEFHNHLCWDGVNIIADA